MGFDFPNFPTLAESLTDYIYDEEGNISRNKMLAVGSMILLLSMIYSTDVFAGHSSHRSHSSHSSHSSGSSGSRYYYHESHVSHQSHVSHSSHSSGDYYYGGSSYGGSTYGAATDVASPVVVSTLSSNPYSAIFDPTFYATKYPDVVAALGTDGNALLNHFLTSGMVEGRQGCETFNVNTYMNRYTDLQSVFGTDLPSYYMHYMNYGILEGRTGI